MIRIRHTYNAASCWEYFIKDKALTPEERTGIWFGKACKKLGWESGSEVKPEQFARLLDGYTMSGESCVGRRVANRRAAYDLVLSAPKSVSLGALSWTDRVGRSEIYSAFKDACVQFGDTIEGMVMRQGALPLRKQTMNVAGALFIHHSSRYGDPHLHGHFVLGNLTWTKGGWRALAVDALFKAKVCLDEIFMRHLQAALKVRGVAAEIRNRACELPIAKKVMAVFSKGRNAIEEASKTIAGSRARMEALRLVLNDRLRPKSHKRHGSFVGVVEDRFPEAFSEVKARGRGPSPSIRSSTWASTLHGELSRARLGGLVERMEGLLGALQKDSHPTPLLVASRVARGGGAVQVDTSDARSKRKYDTCRTFLAVANRERQRAGSGARV